MKKKKKVVEYCHFLTAYWRQVPAFKTPINCPLTPFSTKIHVQSQPRIPKDHGLSWSRQTTKTMVLQLFKDLFMHPWCWEQLISSTYPGSTEKIWNQLFQNGVFVLFYFKAEFKLSVKYQILGQLSILTINGIGTGTQSCLILFPHTHLFPVTTPLALCLAADLAPSPTLAFFPRTASHLSLSSAHPSSIKNAFITDETPLLQSSLSVLRCACCLSKVVSVSVISWYIICALKSRGG